MFKTKIYKGMEPAIRKKSAEELLQDLYGLHECQEMDGSLFELTLQKKLALMPYRFTDISNQLIQIIDCNWGKVYPQFSDFTETNTCVQSQADA